MKTPIRKLDSLTHNDTAATKLINDNFEALQQGVEDALSRSGKKPNFMDDVLDMNMHRIINIADPVDNYDFANKHYVDTKVAEEEAARIAGDNTLRQLINDEKNAREAADTALQNDIDNEISARENADTAIMNSIGNGTITFTQGGVVKGTFTTNQNENTTIYLDAGGSGGGELPKPVVTRKPTFVNSTTGYIDVSDWVETDKQYMPIVITSNVAAVVGSSIAEARKNLYSKCSYDSTNRRIVLTYSDNSYVQTNSFSYALILLPIQTGTSIYVTGITDGLNGYLDNAQVTDNLVTSISSSSTDTQYPSAKCMYDIVGDIETLINAL